MRCGKVRRLLSVYLDEELSAELRTEVEAHLGSCEGCRGQLARLRRVASLLGRGAAPAVPDGFASRVVKRAEELTTRREDVPARSASPLRSWRGMSLPMRLAVAAALVVGLALGVAMGRDTWNSRTARASGDPGALYGLGTLETSQNQSLPQMFLTMVSGSNGRGE